MKNNPTPLTKEQEITTSSSNGETNYVYVDWKELYKDEIEEIKAKAILQERNRIVEIVNDKRTEWLKANEHEFYGKGVTEQIQDVVVEAFTIDLLKALENNER